MDRFPEAFKRFEEDVDVGKIESFKQLELVFERWAGRNWKGSPKQMDALEREAKRLGILLEDLRTAMWRRTKSLQSIAGQAWRIETVNVKGKDQVRYRDLETGRFIKKPQ